MHLRYQLDFNKIKIKLSITKVHFVGLHCMSVQGC